MEMQELVKFLLSSKDDKIEIVIGKMFRFHSYMPRFQVYKYVWSPLIGEEHLKWQHKQENSYHGYDLMSEYIVGHMPLHFSKADF